MFKLKSECQHGFRIRLKGLSFVTPVDKNVLDVAGKVLPIGRVFGKVIKNILPVFLEL